MFSNSRWRTNCFLQWPVVLPISPIFNCFLCHNHTLIWKYENIKITKPLPRCQAFATTNCFLLRLRLRAATIGDEWVCQYPTHHTDPSLENHHHHHYHPCHHQHPHHYPISNLLHWHAHHFRSVNITTTNIILIIINNNIVINQVEVNWGVGTTFII